MRQSCLPGFRVALVFTATVHQKPNERRCISYTKCTDSPTNVRCAVTPQTQRSSDQWEFLRDGEMRFLMGLQACAQISRLVVHSRTMKNNTGNGVCLPERENRLSATQS